jgi:hypothetical protein
MCDNLEIAPNTQSFEFLRGLCSSDDDAVFGVFVGGDRARLGEVGHWAKLCFQSAGLRSGLQCVGVL